MGNNNRESEPRRTNLIQAVKTPLGFFVLVVLLIEGVLGSAAFTNAADRNLLIWGMLILLGGLIVLVGVLAYFKPGILQGRSPDTPFSILIAAPKDLNSLDLAAIDWDEGSCFLVGDQLREPIQLVPSTVGPTLRVHLSQSVASRITPSEPYHLELRDTHGLRWKVARFYFFESLQYLSTVDGKARVLEEYGDQF